MTELPAVVTEGEQMAAPAAAVGDPAGPPEWEVLEGLVVGALARHPDALRLVLVAFRAWRKR